MRLCLCPARASKSCSLASLLLTIFFQQFFFPATIAVANAVPQIENPCWTPGTIYNFEYCCDEETHGALGNAECWDDTFNFNICCVEEKWLRAQNLTVNPALEAKGEGKGQSSAPGGGFQLESAQFLRRREDLKRCLIDYENVYTKVMQWTGFRENPFGDPASCKAVGRRFFWVILNRVMMGFCAPESCHLNEWYIAGPLIVAWTGKIAGSRFGCLREEKEFGLYDSFPPVFSRMPTTAEAEVLKRCDDNMRRYFPSLDVIRLRLLLSENRPEMDERARELNFNVQEHFEHWSLSEENWQVLQLILAPVLLASLLELLFGMCGWALVLGSATRTGRDGEEKRSAGGENMSLSVVRIVLCLTVIYVHTVEAFEWEYHSAEEALLQLRYWPLFVLTHCGHRRSPLIACPLRVVQSVRIVLRNALQRLCRQSPVMFFWTWIVMRVFGRDVPWRPSETINVCHLPPGLAIWLYSSLYAHAWLTQNVYDESVCHNTAIFEAEFQVVMFFVAFACAAWLVRSVIVGVTGFVARAKSRRAPHAFAKVVELGLLLQVQNLILSSAWRHATSREDHLRWQENRLLERSPRTVLYLISVAIIVYVFEEILPDLVSYLFAPPAPSPSPTTPERSGRNYDDRCKNKLTIRSLLPSRCFRWIALVGLPLFVVLLLDSLVVIRGRYFILEENPSAIDTILGKNSLFRLLWENAALVMDITKHYLAYEPMLFDYVLDFPTTFAFYHMIKLLEEKHVLVHVLAQLSFGMNLSNIFVLHYIVGYGLQIRLRINYVLFPAIYGFVFVMSAVVNLFVYLFVEKPCANLAMQLLKFL
eukprot:g3123.t1